MRNMIFKDRVFASKFFHERQSAFQGLRKPMASSGWEVQRPFLKERDL